MLPSVVNCLPIAPSLARGPPIFCAVPPIAPCSTHESRQLMSRTITKFLPTCELLADGSLLVHGLGDRASQIGGGLVHDVGDG